jgi:hypothetical protein
LVQVVEIPTLAVAVVGRGETQLTVAEAVMAAVVLLL